MRYKIVIIAVAMFIIPSLSFGQNVKSYYISGQLMSQGSFNYTDIMKMSQYNSGFGTARSVAMGGAFTSLGADLASMNINPAGLGMYRSSEFGITPTLTLNSFDNSNKTPGVRMTGHTNSKNVFAFNNIGVAGNVFQSSGNLTSFTLGFSYNKLADFNTESTFGLPNEAFSLLDAFKIQLNGTRADHIKGTGAWENLPPTMWGAAMAYKTLLLDPEDPDNPKNDKYVLWTLSDKAKISNYAHTVSEGSVGEFSIAGGFNMQNKFYLGFSFGFQDIYLKQSIYYSEEYEENNGQAGKPADIAPAEGMIYNQHKLLDGWGVNIKLGAIYRPIDALRIGLAIHTPTWAVVRNKYYSYMNSFFVPYDPKPDNSPVYSWDNKYTYDFSTPTRLLTGISWTFKDKGLISFDYERTWYNGIRLEGDVPEDMKLDVKNEVKYHFKGGNTFRVGGEVKPHPMVAVRAGFTHSGSFIKKNAFDVKLDSFDSPVAYKTYNLSAGLGFKLSYNTALDLTYVYMNTKYTIYDLFYAREIYDDNKSSEIGSGRISQTLKRHNAMLTFSCRF